MNPFLKLLIRNFLQMFCTLDGRLMLNYHQLQYKQGKRVWAGWLIIPELIPSKPKDRFYPLTPWGGDTEFSIPGLKLQLCGLRAWTQACHNILIKAPEPNGAESGMTGMFTHGSTHLINAVLRNRNLQDVIHPRQEFIWICYWLKAAHLIAKKHC